MKSIPLRDTLSGPFEILLLISVGFVALPHAANLDPIVCVFFASLLVWRYATVQRPTLRPGKWPLLLLTLAGAALVYVQYHRIYGRDGGSALFMVGLGLKLMEMKTRREVYLVIYLAFFVALTQYLFSQSIPMAAYTLVAVGLSVAVLIGASGGSALSIRDVLRRSGALLGQALPIMLVLFIFFPRIPGPLWKMPSEDKAASTGLSDTIEPGSISRLGRSREPAFRVEFQGPPPPQSQMYWRGPVFWQTDGSRWTLALDRPLPQNERPIATGPSYRYTVIMEPHQRRWVFGLDLPTEFPDQLSQTTDYLLLSRDRLTDRHQYALTSHPTFRSGPLTPHERHLGLRLPSQRDPRLQELVDGWHAHSADPAQLITQALRHFHDQPFAYTLNPPLLADHPVERFLFETRKGFCEHYATAFVVLMRVAGIPARVVTGYQGGQWNPMGRFLEVRQADAHAWAEVWLADRGWTRVDPTAAVAPERIEQGIDLDGQTAQGDISFNPLGEELANRGLWIDWLRRGRLWWASIDHAWNLWVLSYDPDSQRQFWDRLGIVDWRGLLLWIGGLMALCGVVAASLFWPRRKRPSDPALKIYQGFLRQLARRGIIKQAGEGPLDFARRAAREHPEAGPAIAEISATFIALRYGGQTDRATLERLRRQVRAFRG